MALINWPWRRRRGSPGLEPLIAAMANGGGTEQRKRFFAALRRSNLILPSPGLEAKGLPMNAVVQAQSEVAINLIATEAPDGSRALVAFTSEGALQAWRPVGCPYVEIQALQVVGMALRSNFGSIVINPRGPAGGYLSQAELLVLAEGGNPAILSGERQLPKGSVRLSSPSGAVPPHLIETLKTTAATLPAIRSAWILDLQIGAGAPHAGIVLEQIAGADPKALVPAVMSPLQALLAKGEYLDCLPLPPGHELLQAARAAAPPVFRRD